MSEEIPQNITGSNEEIEILVNAAEPDDRELSPRLFKEVNIISSQSSYLSTRSSISEKNEKFIQEDQENNHEIEEKSFEEINNFQNKDILNEEKYIPDTVADYDREELIKQYKEIMEEKLKQQKNYSQYQRKLAEYFQKKRNDEQGMDIEKNENEQDQRYIKYITNFKELQSEEAHQASSIQIQVEEFRKRCEEKLKEVEEVSKAFVDFKYNIGRNAISCHSGKKIANKDLELYHILEMKKEQEVVACRLENIKLKNKLKKYEMQLKVKEELGEGLHLIDFEQLKIENQTYNEKIEDRNEELMKLRKKITTTVQIFTHLKEKLQFIQGENVELSKNLQDLDVTVAQRRDILTRTKQVRDSLRTDNNKLKHQSGLLGNETLLLDFERCVDEGEQLRTRLAQLKTQHKELTICLKSLQRKVEQSSSSKAT